MSGNYHHKRRVAEDTRFPVSQKHPDKKKTNLNGKVAGSTKLSTGSPQNIRTLQEQKTPRNSNKLSSLNASGQEVTPKIKAQNGDTFGDLERVCVKSFRQDYNANREGRETGRLELRGYVSHLLKLADLYQESVKETANVHNISRATGLLNLCLTEIGDESAEQHEEITFKLLSFECSVLKRVLKIKSTDGAEFFQEKNRLSQVEDLSVMRDVFQADFDLLVQSINDLPDEEDLLHDDPLTATEILAEDKIIAVASIMEAEAFERSKTLLGSTFTQCVTLLGNPPCKYSLLKLKEYGRCFTTPYTPWSCFLLIEKDTAATRSYFRQALVLLAMKSIDLGETSLGDLHIHSLAWLEAHVTPTSGFSVRQQVELMKGTSTAVTDCLASASDLLLAASHSKIAERQKVFVICDESKFVVGDVKLYRELVSIRQTVLQRQQADTTYAEVLIDDLEKMVSAVDVFGNVDLTEEDLEVYQKKVVTFTRFLPALMFNLEKSLLAADTKGRLEEMMSPTYHPLSSLLSLVTEKTSYRLLSQFSNSLEEVMSQHLRLKSNGHVNDAADSNTIPDIQPTVLKELKYRKADGKTTETVSIREHLVQSMERNGIATNLPPNISKVSLLSSADESSIKSVPKAKPTTKQKSISPSKRKFTQPKNASNRVRAVEKPTSPPKQPSPPPPVSPGEPEELEVFDRIVTSAPTFSGKPRNVIAGNTAHNLTLSHYLACVLQQAKEPVPQITTNHELPSVNYVSLNRAYLKLLQILLPVIETLRDTLKNVKNLSMLRKALLRDIDFSVDMKELAVALVYLHSGKYTEACHAVYSYIENRSDVTFVGEPFPCDVIEVSEELVEDQTIRVERYQLMMTLLASCQMKRENFEEALSYWDQLLLSVTDNIKVADIQNHRVTCYLALGKSAQAVELANKAISMYKALPMYDVKRSEKVTELQRKVKEIENC